MPSSTLPEVRAGQQVEGVSGSPESPETFPRRTNGSSTPSPIKRLFGALVHTAQNICKNSSSPLSPHSSAKNGGKSSRKTPQEPPKVEPEMQMPLAEFASSPPLYSLTPPPDLPAQFPDFSTGRSQANQRTVPWMRRGKHSPISEEDCFPTVSPLTSKQQAFRIKDTSIFDQFPVPGRTNSQRLYYTPQTYAGNAAGTSDPRRQTTQPATHQTDFAVQKPMGAPKLSMGKMSAFEFEITKPSPPRRTADLDLHETRGPYRPQFHRRMSSLELGSGNYGRLDPGPRHVRRTSSLNSLRAGSSFGGSIPQSRGSMFSGPGISDMESSVGGSQSGFAIQPLNHSIFSAGDLQKRRQNSQGTQCSCCRSSPYRLSLGRISVFELDFAKTYGHRSGKNSCSSGSMLSSSKTSTTRTLESMHSASPRDRRRRRQHPPSSRRRRYRQPSIDKSGSGCGYKVDSVLRSCTARCEHDCEYEGLVRFNESAWDGGSESSKSFTATDSTGSPYNFSRKIPRSPVKPICGNAALARDDVFGLGEESGFRSGPAIANHSDEDSLNISDFEDNFASVRYCKPCRPSIVKVRGPGMTPRLA